MYKNENTWYQKIDAKDTIEFNNDELKLLYKKLGDYKRSGTKLAKYLASS
jgi:hypothetical protein